VGALSSGRQRGSRQRLRRSPVTSGGFIRSRADRRLPQAKPHQHPAHRLNRHDYACVTLPLAQYQSIS
jgi:hypothetical protein